MCLSPKIPDAPKPPAQPPDYESVSSARGDEKRRQIAAYGSQDTILAGGKKTLGQPNVGKTLLGR